MNRQRRKEIKTIQKDLTHISDRLTTLAEEEDEYRDNMPESLMFGEKYDKSNEASDKLNDVADEVQHLIEQLEEIM
jgi:uncharacterized coiled-coil DUF342 family protein